MRLHYGNNSEVIQAQEKQPEINVLTGHTFEEEEPSNERKEEISREYISGLSTEDKAALFTSIMLLDYEGGMDAVVTTQMNKLGPQVSEELSESGLLPDYEFSQPDISDNIIVEPEIDWDRIEGALDSLDIHSILYDYAFDQNLNMDLNLDLGSSFQNISLSMDGKDMADIVDYWLENNASSDALRMFYTQYMSISSYLDNLTAFGKVEKDSPSAINIYADSFEAKDGIAQAIQNYNEIVPEEERISYTDYVALLTSSIQTIIDVISYILIAFVVISLVVSCIMIGIITNISVLERTKEIGILRALGASKWNVSTVFNAETFIIGCLSGIFGVGVSLLSLIPANILIRKITGIQEIAAVLPIQNAIVLVAISIFITIIGGLIPAKKASKQDPVVALRSE